MIPGLFITGVSTSVGKTYVTRGLTRALARSGRWPAALKPIETGADPEPLDAIALARAAGRLELARAPGLYRAALPLSPYAAALETQTAPPEIETLVARIRELAADSDTLLIEGAGGLLVPLDAQRTMAELAVALDLPLLLVARDELGVLSSVLSCAESARIRKLRVAAVILSAHARIEGDPSPAPIAAFSANASPSRCSPSRPAPTTTTRSPTPPNKPGCSRSSAERPAGPALSRDPDAPARSS